MHQSVDDCAGLNCREGLLFLALNQVGSKPAKEFRVVWPPDSAVSALSGGEAAEGAGV